MITSNQTVSTMSVDITMDTFPSFKEFVNACLNRHFSEDFGDLDDHDVQVNKQSLTSGARILSSYNIPENVESPDGEDKVWIISDAVYGNPLQREVTTVLFPSDY